jgi:cytochrome P450
MLRDALDERKDQLRKGTEPDMTEHEINGMVGAANAAGQDTIWSSPMVFVFNMVMHPDIQTKAQKALDEVVGHDRLPTLEDRPKLPYIDCLVQETFRWLPTLPLGLAHLSIQDDVYDGHLIPDGSVISANTYIMTRDENVYHNTDAFDPECFLPVESGGRGEPHPVGLFGFGRRVCPGKLVGELTLRSVIACMQSTMKIEKTLDKKAKPIIPDAEFTNGFVQHPNDFQCVITPPNERSISLIYCMPLE